jgi:asparagine synthetase B (glutamine-hydrolysing)
MPGIAGYVAAHRLEPIQDLIAHMSGAMLRRIGADTYVRTDQRAALAAAGMRPAASIAAQDGRILALTGTIVPDSTLLSRLQAVHSGGLALDLSRKLLALYLVDGAAGLSGLNGSYAVAVWDGPAQTLVVVNDRGGIQPFYYWQAGPGRLALASEIKAIAALPDFPRQIAPAGLFDLIATGQMLGEHTLFEGIHALPPASILTFQRGRLEICQYWEPSLYHSGMRPICEDEVIDQFADLVRGAAKRYLTAVEPGSEACLLITGGLDSRLLAGAIAAQNQAHCLISSTVGHELAVDVRFGRQIARAVGIPHVMIPSNPRYLEDHASECVQRTEGGMNVHAAWILEQSRFLRDNQIPAVITGVGAETISGRTWLNEQGIADPEKALNRMLNCHWLFPSAANLLRPKVARAGRSDQPGKYAPDH